MRFARLISTLIFILWLPVLSGCVLLHPPVDPTLNGPNLPVTPPEQVARTYHLSCPDTIEVTVDGRSPWGAVRQRVGPDGRIDLGPFGRPRVEGETLEEAAATVGRLTGVPPERVDLRIAEYQSQKIYVFGQIKGVERAVPYRGQETVLDLLHRIGGISGGAEPQAVWVIRPHVTSGGRPEIFTVDLRAIVLNRDLRTNVPLEPFDQVYIGETARSQYERGIPPFFRPIYEVVCGINRTDHLGTDKLKPAY